MAKLKARRAKPEPRKTAPKLRLIKSASKKVASAVAKLVDAQAAPRKRVKRAGAGVPAILAADRPRPRATKLPALGQPLTKREMEQILTVGLGRGVTGEGSLKGKLVAKDGLPCLAVVGRDKRELTFLLQGPDQEVLPAYVDKVSVTGSSGRPPTTAAPWTRRCSAKRLSRLRSKPNGAEALPLAGRRGGFARLAWELG